MVIVGAGASIELGMPSVSDIDRLFSEWAKVNYLLANDENKSLYCYLRDEVNRHYNLNSKKGLRKETNFEELLYVLFQLSAALGDNNYKFPMNAFLELKELPKIKSHTGEKFVDGNDLRQLAFYLINKLVIEFRDRCKVFKRKNTEEFKVFKNFINQLNRDFDVAFISLNYDNLITQACPSLFTGFNESIHSFEAPNVYERSDWGLIYHLHGSVHFDMQIGPSNMHVIKWNADLNSRFSDNSTSRNSQNTSEEIDMPTSVIIAGYGKTNQIQRLPFRAYYSKLDEIAIKADAFLFIGYGFNDHHLNNSLHSIRNGKIKKPVVVINWAKDNEDPMQFRSDEWAFNLCKTIPVNIAEMGRKQYKNNPPEISILKENREFEVSSNPDYPLSIWYGGFIEACKNYTIIKSELKTSH